jgi:hypothetical protein
LYARRTLALVLLIVLIAACSNENDDCQSQPAEDMNIKSHEGLYMHIHPTLSITAFGEPVDIPANIGLGTGIMRPIHTHDNSGTLHVEAPCIREFTIGDFFDIVGVRHDSCIMQYCGTVTGTVDGKDAGNYNDIILRDKESIAIVISE